MVINNGGVNSGGCVNYKKYYYLIIDKRKMSGTPTGYYERHHIIPRCLGGSDEQDNIVNLTAKEHFICHLLLAKMYQPKTHEWYKMNHALMMMFSASDNQTRFTSNMFARYRANFSEVMRFSQSAEKNSQYGTRWIYCLVTGVRKKLKNGETLPEGWNYLVDESSPSQRKRKIVSIEDKLLLEKAREERRKEKREKKAAERLQREQDIADKKEKKLLSNIELYTKWYEIYNDVGFEEFCSITGYDKSKPNLVTRFSRYALNYTPQNGKKRGKCK